MLSGKIIPLIRSAATVATNVVLYSTYQLLRLALGKDIKEKAHTII
jgi:hypothetical protein